MAHVLSVNVGRPKQAGWAEIGRTSIDKTPVAGPVEVHAGGLAGDQVSDTENHGGRDQAVYAFAREDLDYWQQQLGRPIGPGVFGENLTTVGIDVNAAEVGEHWRIGTALLEVASVRTPCNDFKNWLGVSGFDNRAWVRRFAARQRPGPYLRVLRAGLLAAGDPIEVVHRPGHGVTVSAMFCALTSHRERLPELLLVDGLVAEAREKAEAYVRGQATAGDG